MAFAIPFMRNFKYFEEDVQLNINYVPKIKQLDNFIKTYGTHRINIIVQQEYETAIETISTLSKANPNVNLVAAFPMYTKDLELKCHEAGLPHYYNQLVGNIDMFFGFLSLDVTDIFITGEICFNLPEISMLAQQHNKSLRCYCDVCQSNWADLPAIKTFFIRPEDIPLYSEYIDTFEFYHTKGKNSNWLNTIYFIYAKTHKWSGELKEIIPSFKDNIPNNYLLPKFGEKRIDCKKKCLYSPDKCHICDRIVEVGDSLKSRNIVIF